jgi:hypothetical protein
MVLRGACRTTRLEVIPSTEVPRDISALRDVEGDAPVRPHVMGGLFGQQKVSYGWLGLRGHRVQQTAVSNKKGRSGRDVWVHGALGLGWHWTRHG